MSSIKDLKRFHTQGSKKLLNQGYRKRFLAQRLTQAFQWIFCVPGINRPCRGFSKNSAGKILPALKFLGELFNFYTVIFSLIYKSGWYVEAWHILMIFKWLNTTKTKIFVRNYTRYTMLKIYFLWFTLGYMTVMRSK